MEENVKNLCAPIPAGLHARVREEQEVSGKTLGQYMAWLIQTFYDNQKEETTMSGDKRTVAFQVPGELFERFKDYLQERPHHGRIGLHLRHDGRICVGFIS